MYNVLVVQQLTDSIIQHKKNHERQCDPSNSMISGSYEPYQFIETSSQLLKYPTE